METRAVDRILKSRIKSDFKSGIKSDLFDFFMQKTYELARAYFLPQKNKHKKCIQIRAVDRILKSRNKSDLKSQIKSDLSDFFNR